MPLNAFIKLSINYLANICSCEKEDILTVWLIHEGSFHYRAQFLILQEKQRTFEVAYQDIGQMFTVCEIEIKSKKDISRRDIVK